MREAAKASFKEWQALPSLPFTLNAVGTRSTASPSFPNSIGDAGGTRPYQVRIEGQSEGELRVGPPAKPIQQP